MLRRRAVTAVSAALALCGTLAIGGGPAKAEGPPQPALPASEPNSDAVTLPTGDQVSPLPGGAFGLSPAEGREHLAFLTLPAADGGVIVVPGDEVEQVLTGAEDARRYNVADLAEHGLTDAAALAEGALDMIAALPPIGGASPDPTLTVTARDHAGKAPDGGYFTWYDSTDHENSGTVDFDEHGVGTAELAPGTYTLTHATWNLGPGDQFTEYVFGISSVTVTEGGTSLTLDGADAAPVTAAVERPDADMLEYGVELSAVKADGTSVGVGAFGPAGTDLYLMPEAKVPGYEFDFRYQTTLVGGTDEPYQYHLAFAEHGEFPADTSFEVFDDKLAAVATDYLGFGVPVEGHTCGYGRHVDASPELALCYLVDTPFPSQRLNLYTASPEIAWDTLIRAGVFDSESGALVDGFEEDVEGTVFARGPSERTFPNGPLASGAAAAQVYDDGGPVLEAALPLGASRNGEHVDIVGYSGDVELSRDGQRVDTVSAVDTREGFALDLDGAGRYTLGVGGSREPLSGPYAFKSFVDWSFDLDPAAIGEPQDLLLPAVAITAPDVTGGVTANREQPVSLALVDDAGRAVAAAEMSLEVSYDGFTWVPVDLDLDKESGTATAVLHHPEDATYVSVRMTAADAAGTEVEQTTIWAYGLN